MAKYRVTKDVKSDKEGKTTFVVFPDAGNAEADGFAKEYVGMYEASVKEFADFTSLVEFLKSKKDSSNLFAWAGGKSLRSLVEQDFASEGLFAPATSEEPKAPAATAATEEAVRSLRLAKGIIEDIGRCRYGVSIASLSSEAAGCIDAAITTLTK